MLIKLGEGFYSPIPHIFWGKGGEVFFVYAKKKCKKKNKQPMLIIRIEEHPFVFAQLRKKDPKSAMQTFDKKTDLPGVVAFEDANGTKQSPSCDILSENAKLGCD